MVFREYTSPLVYLKKTYLLSYLFMRENTFYDIVTGFIKISDKFSYEIINGTCTKIRKFFYSILTQRVVTRGSCNKRDKVSMSRRSFLVVTTLSRKRGKKSRDVILTYTNEQTPLVPIHHLQV